MRFLLDTVTVVWATGEVHRLSARAKNVILDESFDLLVSAVTPWELAIKWSAGKFHPESTFIEIVAEQTRALRTLDLPISRAHAMAVATLPRLHGDPFDRILIAQALVEGVPIITSDRRMGRYGVETVW